MIPMEYALLIVGLTAFLAVIVTGMRQAVDAGRTVFFYRPDTGACSGWAALANGSIEHRVSDRRIENLFNKGIIVPNKDGALSPAELEQRGNARILVPGSAEHFTAAVAEIRSLGYFAVVTTAEVDR